MNASFSLGIPLALATALLGCESPSGTGPSFVTDGPVMTLEPGSVVIKGGTSLKLRATVTGQDGGSTSPENVSWISSNEGVATVHTGGVVQGLSAGQTMIVATWQNTRATAQVTVTGGSSGKAPVACLVFPKDGGKC